MKNFTYEYKTKVIFGENTAEKGISVLTNFIKECGLPTKMNELSSKEEITSDLLCKVADTCKIIKTNPRELTQDEIFEILTECL